MPDLKGRATRSNGAFAFIALVLLPVACMVMPVVVGGADPAGFQVFFPLAAFAPVTVACLLIAKEGPDALGIWWRRQLRLPHWTWFVAGLLTLPGLSLLAIFLADGMGWPTLPWREFDWPRDFFVLAGASLFMMFIPGLTEEPGWRSFLQQRLEVRWGLFPASLAVGLVWALWHSTDLVMHSQEYDATRFLSKAGWMISASLVFGALLRRSGGCLLVAIATHLGGNLTFAILPIAPWRGADPRVLHLASALTFAVGAVLVLTGSRAPAAIEDASEPT